MTEKTHHLLRIFSVLLLIVITASSLCAAAATADSRRQLKESIAGVSEKIVHTHTDTVFFHDAETGKTWGYCLGCGQELSYSDYFGKTDSAEKKITPVETNAVMRSGCVHQFSYYTLGASTHHGICSLCGFSFVESHNIVPATCTACERCSVCGHHEADWDEQLGHLIGYVPDYINGTHTIRCVRADNDCVYTCDYIISENVPCQWGASYVDPPYGNSHEHYIWQDCTVCGNPNWLGSYPCLLPNTCLYPH